MADTVRHIASAVVIPDNVPGSPKSPSTGAKRRQSSELDSISKRTKIDEDFKEGHDQNAESDRRASPPDNSNERTAPNVKSTDSLPDRRKSSIQEEKKRGQRLFGGLLSALNRSAPNGQQKRRQDIERRQQEKAKQQKADDEIQRAQKLADLKAIRMAEQIKFDEQTMRTRHTNTLAMAHSLFTKSKPVIYYKPWDLLPEEDERIKSQVAEAEALINREVAEFNMRHPKEQGQDASEAEANITSQETVGEPHAESPTVSKIDTTNPTPDQVSQPDQIHSDKQSMELHNGEVLVENDEDTVIY